MYKIQAGPWPSSSPRFPLAVDEQVVEEEEGSLLDVACRDLQQSALQEELGADVCEVRALGRQWTGSNEGLLQPPSLRPQSITAGESQSKSLKQLAASHPHQEAGSHDVHCALLSLHLHSTASQRGSGPATTKMDVSTQCI